MVTRLRATERRPPYAITETDTGERAPPYSPVLDLPTAEGWKAELTLVVGYSTCIPRWLTCPQTVTHTSSNNMIATRPRVEPPTFDCNSKRPNRYANKPPLAYN